MNGGHDIVELNGQTDSYDVSKSSSLVSKEEEPPYENVQRKTRRKPSRNIIFITLKWLWKFYDG